MSKSKKGTVSFTVRVRPIKMGKSVFIPVSNKMLKRLSIDKSNGRLYWTAVDGVLQLSANTPAMVIPILDQPEDRFEAQSD